MSAAPDVLHAKTDDELRFFVNHPQFYQPELVQAARRELRRRGQPESAAANQPSTPPAAPRQATPAPEVVPYLEEAAPVRRPALAAAVLAVLVVALAGGWLWWRAHGSQARTRTQLAEAAARQQQQAAEARKLSPEALKLETVATYTIPAYDVPQLVREQLASVPASQKRDEQVLRQFRALSKRFWAAETQSEYLTNAAYTHSAAPTFDQQALQARQTWHEWNRAAVYTFKFGPVMRKQFELMKQVGSSQQHILERLPRLLPGDEFLGDQELKGRQIDVQAWMAGLRPTSPVTGRKYKVAVLHYHE